MGPGLDELGISMGGVPPPAAATLDGPIGQEDAAEAPGDVPSRLSAAGTERTIRVMPAAAGALPPGDASRDPSGDPGASPAPPPPQNEGQQPTHPKAFDASKGTPLDPLRNKTYDLNYAKTVPPICDNRGGLAGRDKA